MIINSITNKIDKLVKIVKMKQLNTIVVVFWLIGIAILAYVDQNYPKHISKKFAIPIFIIMGIIGLFYLIIFIRIRILTDKEKGGTNHE